MSGRRSPGLVLLLLAGAALGGCEELEDRFSNRSPGERLYRKLCAECHGVDGAGDTPRFMGNASADLMDDSWEHGGGDAGGIEAVVRDGVFGQMPAYPDLTPEEMRQLVDYVLKLRGETADPGAAGPS